jgi:(1->4)-alpha-D-glucan 1-alpha-D-glucosylmutase
MGGQKPDPGDAIMLYQMIVGAWPMQLNPADEPACQAFAERLAVWQQKALREAKLRTDWTAPNQVYEATARDFLFRLFAEQKIFLHDFVGTIAPAGAVNGLAQTVLKMTVPGMPDFFQGTEFWDFSLVDPDNRRPVDYQARRAPAARQSWRDGRIKQDVIRLVLALRRQAPDLFARGDYTPLRVRGPLENHIIVFVRTFGQSAMIVAVPRLVHRLVRVGDQLTLDPRSLVGNSLLLPQRLHGRTFYPVLTDGDALSVCAEVPLESVLTRCPIAVMTTIEST